ncbi:hypothetical protein [Caballeronia sp. S22]|uniref:hypothetical protein n=1 Tax=Caballeronia sp. S22 TaxID=3137182 RepID=UPI0035315EF9
MNHTYDHTFRRWPSADVSANDRLARASCLGSEATGLRGAMRVLRFLRWHLCILGRTLRNKQLFLCDWNGRPRHRLGVVIQVVVRSNKLKGRFQASNEFGRKDRVGLIEKP